MKRTMNKITKTMALTEEQLKVVFEMGAASEGTSLDEVSFEQKRDGLLVYEKFREDKSDAFSREFWFKTTLITPYGVKTIAIERPPEYWTPDWPW